jgi:hypothetical protein
VNALLDHNWRRIAPALLLPRKNPLALVAFWSTAPVTAVVDCVKLLMLSSQLHKNGIRDGAHNAAKILTFATRIPIS